MKIQVEMPPEHYDSLLNQCVDWLPEYTILKNALVLHREVEGEDQRSIAFICEDYQALTLLAAAQSLYPPAAEHIKKALAPGAPVIAGRS